MPITDKANIRPSINNVNLQTFKKPVPAFCVLILNKGKGDGNYLFVAINSDRRQYCFLIFPCQESAVNTQNKKGVNEGPHMHQCRRKLAAKYLAPLTSSVHCMYQKHFQDFCAQLLQTYEVGCHMKPHKCQTASQTLF